LPQRNAVPSFDQNKGYETGAGNFNLNKSIHSSQFPPAVPEGNPLDEVDQISDETREVEPSKLRKDEYIGGDEDEPYTQFEDLQPGEALRMKVIKPESQENVNQS